MEDPMRTPKMGQNCDIHETNSGARPVYSERKGVVVCVSVCVRSCGFRCCIVIVLISALYKVGVTIKALECRDRSHDRKPKTPVAVVCGTPSYLARPKTHIMSKNIVTYLNIFYNATAYVRERFATNCPCMLVR
eukprot:1192270-Prorocentrum_minimum.AAC.6